MVSDCFYVVAFSSKSTRGVIVIMLMYSTPLYFIFVIPPLDRGWRNAGNQIGAMLTHVS